MALRATSGPTLAKNSAPPGGAVSVTAKVENTGVDAQRVTLFAEGTPLPIVFEPASAEVPGKSRKSLTFTWRATLPPDKPALTYRGKLVLRQAGTGALVGEAPLDLYVG